MLIERYKHTVYPLCLLSTQFSAMAPSNKSTREKRKGSSPPTSSTSSRNSSGRVSSSSSTSARNEGNRSIPQPSGLLSIQQGQTPRPEVAQSDARQWVPVQRPWQDRTGGGPSDAAYISPMDHWEGQSPLDEPWNDVYGVFDSTPQLSSDGPVNGGSWSDAAWSMEVNLDQQQYGGR